MKLFVPGHHHTGDWARNNKFMRKRIITLHQLLHDVAQLRRCVRGLGLHTDTSRRSWFPRKAFSYSSRETGVLYITELSVVLATHKANYLIVATPILAAHILAAHILQRSPRPKANLAREKPQPNHTVKTR